MGLIMNERTNLFAVLVMACLLTGCVAHYMYRSNGKVTMPSGNTRGALLYWYKDEGFTWYGKPYKQTDSSLSLLVCTAIPNTFSGGQAGTPAELLSDAGDVRMARLDDTGGIEPLPTPRRLGRGHRCGVILVDGKPVGTNALDAGVHPVVVVLCRAGNDYAPPYAYPAIGAYTFDAVSRTRTDGERSAPPPCKNT